jgi:hypothetical protein
MTTYVKYIHSYPTYPQRAEEPPLPLLPFPSVPSILTITSVLQFPVNAYYTADKYFCLKPISVPSFLKLDIKITSTSVNE